MTVRTETESCQVTAEKYGSINEVEEVVTEVPGFNIVYVFDLTSTRQSAALENETDAGE
uniref:Uncharacterized protein n=1 Tax=Parascaris equorum TaxID=6256 RepID=A0A914R492_PAREQ